MGIRRDNIFAYFRRASAKSAYEYLDLLLSGEIVSKPEQHYATFKGASEAMFRKWARLDASPSATNSELDGFRRRAEDDMRDNRGKSGDMVFNLIAGYVRHNLLFEGEKPVVRHDDLLGWQEITTLLGQDMFVCVRYALNDISRPLRVRDFVWPSIIKSDNKTLEKTLERGIAENHAHLYATAQYFELTWTAAMNHYDSIDAIAGNISEFLSDDTHEWSLNECPVWLKRAAILRVALFQELYGVRRESKSKCERRCECKCKCFRERLRRWLDNPSLCTEAGDAIDVCRHTYGARFDNGTDILDYAFVHELSDRNMRHPLRALAGERHFLYRCYRKLFAGEYGEIEQQMLYTYLLIKTRFRAELVQSNRRSGFDNFQRYQDRKDFFQNTSQNAFYNRECINLAIRSVLCDKDIQSAEFRITPADSANTNYNTLTRIIRAYRSFPNPAPAHANPAPVPVTDMAALMTAFEKTFAPPDSRKENFFFVYHLPKRREKPLSISVICGDYITEPRSGDVRNRNRKSVVALASMLQKNPAVREWVRGIDGCSMEIGCRPEVMAQAIRAFADFVPNWDFNGTLSGINTNDIPVIHKTFHVGEDFLDLADGLRAVDEALLFMNLKRGDRIGHGIALGLDAVAYYERKEYKINLRKQDMLDNIVWLICRSADFGLGLRTDLESRLRGVVSRLFTEIYQGSPLKPSEFDIPAYFRSWKLRGDNPSAYLDGTYRTGQTSAVLGSFWNYDNYALNEDEDEQVKQCRKDDMAAELYKQYHYSKVVRDEGDKYCTIEVTRAFSEAAERMQYALLDRIAKKAVAIETNPTSNKLISTFKRYDKHPILRFYNYRLANERGPQITVSINTDDQGVFSTTLKNEYYLMSAALERVETPDGERRYSQRQITDWIDDVREMGLQQSFR
jgi:hypothetical protein